MTPARNTAEITIREPRASELAICRMLLPEAAADPVARHFRLAFSDEGRKLVGALSYRDDATVVGGVRVHVIPTHRRLGIGTRLIDYAAREGCRLGRRTLLADVDLKNEPDAEPFLLAQSFRKAGTVTFAEIEIADLRERMKAAAARMEPGNGSIPDNSIPENVSIAGLADVDVSEVTNLYAAHIAHMEPIAGLREAFRIEQQKDSVALLVDGRLAGFVLARVDAGTLHVPAWVVKPEYRGRSIGNALLSALAKRVRGRVERMKFEFTDVSVATPRVTHLPGYRITKIAARFAKERAA